MQFDTLWTPLKVAEALVRAYRLMPGRPVLSSGGAFSVDDHVVSAFGWPNRFVADGRDRRYLMTWARCMAAGESVRQLYKGYGWPRSTAERRRRAALAGIANGLNRDIADRNEDLTMAPNALEPCV